MAVSRLRGEDHDSLDGFFELIESNLREGRVRLVFFLEQAPNELKSIVDFLNRQMERSEVLIVEARQYQCDDTRLVAPSLFGFTEEARRAKRAGSVGTRTGSRRQWDEASFFAKAEGLDPATCSAVHKVHQFATDHGLSWTWGTGSANGSFNLIEPRLCRRSFLSVWTDGRLYVRADWYRDSPESTRFIEALEAGFARILEIPSPGDLAFWELKPEQWVASVDALLELISQLLRAPASSTPS